MFIRVKIRKKINGGKVDKII